MKCEETAELMSEHLDGRLDQDQERLLQEHLAGCPQCREDFAALKETVELVRSIPAVEPPSDLLADVRRRLETRKRRTLWYFLNTPQARVALAASVALVVGVYSLQWIGERAESPAPKPRVVTRAEMPAKPDLAVKSAPASARPVAPAARVAKEEARPGPRPAASAPADKPEPVNAPEPPAKYARREAEGRIWSGNVQPSGGGSALQVGKTREIAAKQDRMIQSAAADATPAEKAEETQAAVVALPGTASVAAPAAPPPLKKGMTDALRPMPVTPPRAEVAPARTLTVRGAKESAVMRAIDELTTAKSKAAPFAEAPAVMEPSAAEPADAESGAAAKPQALSPSIERRPDGSTVLRARIPASLYPRLLERLEAMGAVSSAGQDDLGSRLRRDGAKTSLAAAGSADETIAVEIVIPAPK